MRNMTIGAPHSHLLPYALPLLLAPHLGITGIAFSCAIGWTAMLLFEVPYYFVTCQKQALPKTEP